MCTAGASTSRPRGLASVPALPEATLSRWMAKWARPGRKCASAASWARCGLPARPRWSALFSVSHAAADAVCWQNVSVVLSGPTSFVGAIFTSYQFSDRPFGNLFTSTGAATSYNCSTQTGTLKTVPVGTWTVRVRAALLRRRELSRCRLRAEHGGLHGSAYIIALRDISAGELCRIYDHQVVCAAQRGAPVDVVRTLPAGGERLHAAALGVARRTAGL